MKRRSFFGVAAAASGAALLPASAAAAASAASPSVVRTATSEMVVLHTFAEPTQMDFEKVPEGFVPCAAVCDTHYDVLMRLFDDEGDVLELHSAAFKFGPIDFWRPVVGKLRCELTCMESPSVMPTIVVVIYGEIDID